MSMKHSIAKLGKSHAYQAASSAAFAAEAIDAVIFRSSEAASLRDAVLLLRKAIFIDHLGWPLPITAGREIDALDSAASVYCLVRQGGRPVGCWRALPTQGPYLLESVFPILLHGKPAPRDSAAWEISRFGLLPEAAGGAHVAMTLAAAMFTLAKRLRIERLVAVTDVGFERYLRRLGIRATRYGPPILCAAGALVGGEIPVDQQSPAFVAAIHSYQSSIHFADAVPVEGVSP